MNALAHRSAARPKERTGPTTAPASGAVRTETIFPVGEVLADTYEILSVLGEGGMGQVFEAHDRALNRRVAVKAAWPELKPHAIRREAQALSAVRHPSMVTVHALGVHGGVEYVVMERVYGVSLSSHLEQHRHRGELFTVPEAIDVLIGLSEGLAAVHRAGVAHRDVKPSNVMLAPGNRVVLMDFGISLPEIDCADETEISGSPQYMAPEAIKNSFPPGSAFRVDLYALGVIGYEMLVGNVPFKSDNIRAIFHAHLTEIPKLVSELRPQVPADLSALIAELLSKDPEDRPASMEAVAWRLRNLRTPVGTRSVATVGEVFSVLIVDDDRNLAEVMKAVIKRHVPDATVRTEHSAEAALEQVRKQPPHAMLLDLELPGMNGMELCMYLRGTHLADRCAIIMVTGNAESYDLKLLEHLGVTRFVPKGSKLAEGLAPMVRELRKQV